MKAWKNLSVSKKLYSVVGIMAMLICCELMALSFAMNTLSAVRAFVGGEGLWSKAQKNAVFSFQRYRLYGDERDYEAFLNYLKIPEGDHLARIELLKENPDLNVVYQGFRDGQIHKDDIPPVVDLIRRFYWVSYLSRALEIWGQADLMLAELKDTGIRYHDLVKKGLVDPRKSDPLTDRIRDLNHELTLVEDEFSYVLGEGSRWLEHFILVLLFIAVFLVESVGIFLTFSTSRNISNSLKDIIFATGRIRKGDFSQEIAVRSKDELGIVSNAVNEMSRELRDSKENLERKVQERTLELAKLAEENADLYLKAKSAVQDRDEFLSVASHELRTPLAALELQLQMLERILKEEKFDRPRASDFLGRTRRQVTRLERLLDELLDLTRLRLGRFEVNRAPNDLTILVSECVSTFKAQANKVGSDIQVTIPESVPGHFDELRMGQVVTNLLSNAIKYGEGKAIEVTLDQDLDTAIIKVRDHGMGIPEDQLARVFERYERVGEDSHIQGLGLGLYVSSQIVGLHGGTLSVESTLGKGSTFTVEIPLYEKEPAVKKLRERASIS